MDFLEKDLEEIIFKSNRELLDKKGLTINGKLLRQVKIGNYGVADLIEITRTYDEYQMIEHERYWPELVITVYELKQNKIGISPFLQAVRYVKGIKRYIEKNKKKLAYSAKFQVVLIGRKIDTESDFIYLKDSLPSDDGVEFLQCYTYSFDIEGIKFEYVSEYSLINEGF